MSVTGPFSQAGIFFATDLWYTPPSGGPAVGMVSNDMTLLTAQRNAAVLQYLVYLAQESSLTDGVCSDPTMNPPWAATIVIPGHTSVPPPVGSGMPPDTGAVYYLAIPTSPYTPQLSNAAVDIGCPSPIRILGTGNVKLIMLSADDIFYVNTRTSGDINLGGVTFEDLELKYATGLTAGAAIHVAASNGNDNFGNPTKNGAQNVRINRCIFSECPIGVWFEQALQCSMFQCTGSWVKNNGTAIKIGGPDNGYATNPFGKDIFITDCLFEVQSGAPTPNIAMDIIAVEHVRAKSVRFDNFDQGILIRPGESPSGNNVIRCFFSDVTVYAGETEPNNGIAGTALTLEPQNSSQGIAQVAFENCLFEPGDNTTLKSSVNAGITINPNGGTIDNIRFVSCYACRWTGPGLSIGLLDATGVLQNVEVLGGMYAGNNFGGAGALPYGIAVFGPSNGVRIVGVSCVGQYDYITDANIKGSPQQVGGIYIAGAASDVVIDSCDLRKSSSYGATVLGAAGAVPTNIFIRNCDATGYSSYSDAVNIGPAADVSNVQVTNCAGYNDQHPLLRGVPPTSATAFYNYTYGYFGPVEFYTAPQDATITSISVDGNITRLTMGSFLLVPGEYAEITWAAVGVFVPSFFMIGK